MSYLDLNRFIDDQVKLLNKPLLIDDELIEAGRQFGISDSQIRSILFKCNLQIKRQIRANFERPLVHDVIQKVLISEKMLSDDCKLAGSKLEQLLSSELDERLASSWPIENKVRRIADLADCMPDGEFNILGNKDSNWTSDGIGELKSQTSNDAGLMILPASHSELNLQPERETVENGDTLDQKLYRKDEDSEENAMFRERYNQLRTEYLRQHSELQYQVQKLDYLRHLRKQLTGGSQPESNKGSYSQRRSVDLQKEMERFEILVEKLQREEMV